MKLFETKRFLSTVGFALGLFFAGAAQAALYEAEDAGYGSAGIKSDAGASGGYYLDGNPGFNVTWTIDFETAGNKALFFTIKVPSGDRSMGVFVNNTKVGVVSSSSRAWEEVGLEAAMLAGSNTVQLRDSEGTSELDVDSLFVSRITTFNYQAEDMALTGFSVQSSDVAAGSHFIQLGGDSAGTAVQVFGGDAGMYNIDTFFFDENDGVGSLELSVDGLVVDSWMADGTFGTAGVSAESLTSHQSAGVNLLAGSVIQLQVMSQGGELGRVDEMTLTFVEHYVDEAEDMTLDGYVVEENSAGSGGSIVRLTGDKGAIMTTLSDLTAGVYDLTIGYFDETDGESAFKLYVNDKVVDAWLADRMLGSSNATTVNRQERLIKNLYLRSGDVLEICGFKDGDEFCGIDGYNLQTATIPPGISMDWNSDGTIAHLVLNGAEHLDSSEESGVIFRIFDGYGIDTLEQYAAEQNGSFVEIHEADLDYARFYFRMDEYEHHIALRLIGMDGVPREDPSLSIRLEIPYTTLPGYQLLDAAVTVDISGGVLELDWNRLASRGLLAGGQIALYAASDETAALAEIEQVHTDNGNLDDYYAWIDGFPILGTDADLFADPDGDGINNLTEYALGGAPSLGNNDILPRSGTIGDEFAIQYNRRLDAAARGLTYSVQVSDNLVDPDWSTNGVNFAGAGTLDAEFESVTNSVSTIGTTNQFLKLEVEFSK